MPLNWSIKNVDDYKDLYIEVDEDSYMLWPKAEAMIFALGWLGCGPSVTEDNYGEIAVRLDMYETATGRALCWEDGKRSPFTLADVKRLIGMHTNHGGRKESRASWKKRVLEPEEVSA